jgi:HEAT repeat protein
MRAGFPASASLTTGLLLVAIVGCSKSPAATTPRDSVTDLVRAAAGSDNPVQTLNAAARRRGEVADLSQALTDPSPPVRRTAAYVAALWADDARDVSTLTPLLADPDVAVRAIVAGSLAGLGHAGARAALASLRGSSEAMPWSDPPVTVGRFATSALMAIDAAGGRP